MPAGIEVAQDGQALAPHIVVQSTGLSRGSRGSRRAVQPRNKPQRRQVRNDEMGRSRVDEALNVDHLLNGGVDHLFRGGCIENVIRAAPDDEERLVIDRRISR